MNNKQWQEIIERTVRTIQQISATKGKEYTRDSPDLLDNFTRHGTSLGAYLANRGLDDLDATDTVLEPSCGVGAAIDAAIAGKGAA